MALKSTKTISSGSEMLLLHYTRIMYSTIGSHPSLTLFPCPLPILYVSIIYIVQYSRNITISMYDKTILQMRNRTVTTKFLHNGDVLFWGRFVLGSFYPVILPNAVIIIDSCFFLVYIEGPCGLILKTGLERYCDEKFMG